ncbi:uncharacterized protein LOC126908056 [Daktulosphaira vitifoliae]|uniref:uncharacterized protein LOC126908056 n=1 Tax=Daktulosphaira vitifoliae TaxID=58002 RepID=UPI0021AA2E11|nr:uncharacterized protein LOC126908056 [Daktulosphaira vitifoliae]
MRYVSECLNVILLQIKMSELTDSIVFRIKLLEVVLSILSLVPFFGQHNYPANDIILGDFVYLTLYGFLGIGIVVLASFIRSESISEKLIFYTTATASIMHLMSSIIVIVALLDVWNGGRFIGVIFIIFNTLTYGWDAYQCLKS